MEKETLLQKAKQIKSKPKKNAISDEEYELGIAWAKGELTLNQINKVMDFRSPSNGYTLLIKSFQRLVSES